MESKILDVSKQGLTEIPELPTSLETLWCSDNQLTSLPELPDNLDLLYCGDNNLVSLIKLPNRLRILDCRHNKLTKLTKLPDTLEALYCSNNQLTSLPELPDSLKVLYCNNNPFEEPLSEDIHEEFDLGNLYNKDLIDKFESYDFQYSYLKEKLYNFKRLEVFGYAKGIKEQFPEIFQFEDIGLI